MSIRFDLALLDCTDFFQGLDHHCFWWVLERVEEERAGFLARNRQDLSCREAGNTYHVSRIGGGHSGLLITLLWSHFGLRVHWDIPMLDGANSKWKEARPRPITSEAPQTVGELTTPNTQPGGAP